MADFYKLLVYETGGFFVDYCDTAESRHTMVLLLPSDHRGGEQRR
ncbi:hypothetical protein [Bradyrhizobium sp. CCBAU 051011]|nr:hypothetical protein [Bradyrhizobium sp. CCBAU 051011]